MQAPTRRAPPVMSTTLPLSTPSPRAACAAARFFDDMEADYDGKQRALNVPPALARGSRAFAGRGADDPRAAAGRGRVAVVRDFHGAGAVRARPRLLQRGRHENRPVRGFHD